MIPAEQQTQTVIPEQETALSTAQSNIAENIRIARKAALAASSLGHDYEESKRKYEMYAQEGKVDAIRGDVSSLQFNAKRQSAISEMSDLLRQKTTEQLDVRLQSLAVQEYEKNAMESQYVQYLESGKSPEWRALANQNKDIFQRKQQEAVMVEQLMSLRSKYAGLEREEEEGWFLGTLNESVDFFKDFLQLPNIIDFFNPVEGTIYTQATDLRKLVALGRNLPVDKRPEWLEKFEEELTGLGFFLIDNPQDQVDMIDNVLASNEQLEATNALYYLNWLGSGVLTTLGGKVIKYGRGQKEFKPQSATGNTKDVDPDTVVANKVAGPEKAVETLEPSAAKANQEIVPTTPTRQADEKADAVADKAPSSTATEAVKVPKGKTTTKAVDDVVPEEDAIDQISSLRSPDSMYDENVGGYLYRALERTRQELVNRVASFAAPARLNEVLADLVRKQEEFLGNRQVVSTTIDSKDGSILMRFGQVNSKPFKTERGAQNAADTYGFKPDDYNLVETPHGYMVELKLRGDTLEGASEELEMGILKAGLGNMEDVVPDIIAMARLAEDAENALFKTIEKVVNRDLRKFYGNKGNKLFSVIHSMQGRSKATLDGEDIGRPRWLTLDEFAEKYYQKHGHYPTTDEVKAYGAYRMLNDFDVDMKYKTIEADILARGDSVFTLKLGDKAVNALGRRVDVGDLFNKSTNRNSFAVLGDEVEYIGAKTLEKDKMDELLKDYDVIEINPANREDFMRGGYSKVPLQYALVPKASKGRQATPRDLIGYVEGGRLRNNAKHFIKVGREVTDEADNVIRLQDVALFSARNRKLAAEGEAKINKLVQTVRDAVNRGETLTDDVIENIGLVNAGIRNFDEAAKFVKENGLLDKNVTIQAVRDREVVKLSKPTGPASIGEDSVRTGYYGSRLFGARSEEGVKDIDFKDMQMMNPMEALADSLTLTARYASTIALKERSLQYLKSKYGKYLDTESDNPFALLEANIKNAETPLANTIKAHQKFLKNMFSQMTDEEMAWKLKMDKMFNWVFDRKDKLDEFFGRGGPTADTLAKRENTIEYFGRDPVTRIRSVTFHSTLGMLSLPSFIMQAINVTNIMAVAGTTGIKAGYQAMFIRSLMFARDPETIKMMSEKAWKAGGFESSQDALDAMKLFQDLGYDNIGLNHAFIAGMNGMQLQGRISKYAGDISRVFFDQGELLNRLTAMRTAMLEYKTANKGADVFERGAREWIANRTHTLTLGMSRSDNQLLLRDNWASTMTQFWSYPIRMTNAMLSTKLGGSKAFTSAEKTRLVAVNALLWGSAGVPMYSLLTDFINDKTDLSEGQQKALVDGLFDYALYALSDGAIDGDMGDRVGNAQFYVGLWKNLTKDSTALEFFSGAAGSRGGSVLGIFDFPAQVIRAGLNNDISITKEAGLNIMSRLVTGVNNLHKLFIGLQYNKVRSRAGADMFDISDAGAWAQFWGVPPKGYSDIGKLFEYREDQQKLLRDATSGYMIHLREMDKAYEDGNMEAFNNIQNSMAAYSAALDNEYVRSQALSRALDQSTEGQTMMEKMIRDEVRKRDKGAEVNDDLIEKYQETL